ncbi:LysR family transcriptional regulator [Segnochrobactrum spirostomi]|uniref:LysR family transcriptional regulator n=1 Tax=Segnochrobactrum spirostomi TaxID=2608987 RepID=A0A6A7Y567_9HYPH|nr:LysR family transcriptional regulator [Segnochrobactrum spirostomi]MQT13318.1 LysR family transcriptional regulator [Segnochrobactrum spirostomi]
MDRLTSMELFKRIVERRSFSAAAAEMGLSRPVATTTIKALETRLGVRLLQRSTRHVAPTPEGATYYERCVRILNDIEDADQGVGGVVRGLLKIDVPGTLAREILVPRLPDFLARHPGLAIQVGEGERFVDLVREGFDCVVRAGDLAENGMVFRRLGFFREITCAAPAYLARHGIPATPDDLDGHEMIAFVSSRTQQPLPLEFHRDGRVVEVVLPARVMVMSADVNAAAVRAGLGLMQAPRHRFAEDLASGALIEVLADYAPAPTPLSIVYPSSRQLSPRVRVFIDWAVEVISPYLEAQ